MVRILIALLAATMLVGCRVDPLNVVKKDNAITQESVEEENRMRLRGKWVPFRKEGIPLLTDPATLGDFQNTSFESRRMIELNEDVDTRWCYLMDNIMDAQIVVSNTPLTSDNFESELESASERYNDMMQEVYKETGDAKLANKLPLLNWNFSAFPYYLHYRPETYLGTFFTGEPSIEVSDNREFNDPLDDYNVKVLLGNRYQGIASEWKYIYVVLDIRTSEKRTVEVWKSMCNGVDIDELLFSGEIDNWVYGDTLYYEVNNTEYQ